MALEFDIKEYLKSKKAKKKVVYKPESYLPIDPCLQEIMGLPGLPRGHIYQAYGKSDTGKTTILNHLIAEIQKKGEDLPVVYITEAKVDWDRATQMGVDLENNIIIEEDFETIEQVFDDMFEKIAEQKAGLLPKNLVFLWDSIGNTLSEAEFEVDSEGKREIKGTMMKAAKVIKGYMRHFSPLINKTRRDDSPFLNTMFLVNQAYTQPPKPPATESKLVPYGGDGVWFASSLSFEVKRVGKLFVTRGGKRVKFAIKSKIAVLKNHISGIEKSGEFIIAPDKIMINKDTELKKYKDIHKKDWGKIPTTEEEG